MYVLGRPPAQDGATAHLGTYRARDGSDGARVGVDLDRPHAAVVVGKRGHGKSHTLGVLSEDAAQARGVAPVIADPTGALTGLVDGTDGEQSRLVRDPTIRPAAIPPPAWPDLFGRARTDPAGTLLWQAAAAEETLGGMCERIETADDDRIARRAARNHLELAKSWGIFDSAGLSTSALFESGATVLDLSGLGDTPANAVVRGLAHALYRRRIDDRDARLPWLFLDEAHVFFDGVAGPALETLLRRGRGAGVSLVAATQRPSAVPEVALSQADLLVAHRLTARADLAALADAAPTYLDGAVEGRLPGRAGGALVVDDVTESVHEVRVRERTTPHRGASPRASDVADGEPTGPSRRDDSRGVGGQQGSGTARRFAARDHSE